MKQRVNVQEAGKPAMAALYGVGKYLSQFAIERKCFTSFIFAYPRSMAVFFAWTCIQKI